MTSAENNRGWQCLKNVFIRSDNLHSEFKLQTLDIDPTTLAIKNVGKVGRIFDV